MSSVTYTNVRANHPVLLISFIPMFFSEIENIGLKLVIRFNVKNLKYHIIIIAQSSVAVNLAFHAQVFRLSIAILEVINW